MDCPRCGATVASSPDCPRCGVILAKARPSRPSRAPGEPGRARRGRLLRPALGLVLVALAGVAVRESRRPSPAAPLAPPESPPPDTAPVAALPAWTPPSAPPTPDPEAAAERLRAARAADADSATAARLSERLRSRAPVTAEDVRLAEELYGRYPGPAADLLQAVLIEAAAGHRSARRYGTAATLLERAAALAPASPHPPGALLALHLESGEWPAAESAARAVLALRPADAGAARGLAYALVRQDRSREAIEWLASFLDAHPEPETRALLERIRHDAGTEASLDEARLAHFHVRYDGDAHEDVGREILRLLDRHRATLVLTFGHEPAAPVPVVLLSRESYFDATGAPAWSGGQYDSFDGRVRIPIGGLTAALADDIDQTLIHELTHAFVADLSRGVAPREVHEGLAQFMEGKRTVTLLGEPGLRALADGRFQGVNGFYVSALAFVEDLLAQRGQGGVNDLLRAMAETGNADEAFRRVYGRDLDGLRKEWSTRLRQRYGS